MTKTFLVFLSFLLCAFNVNSFSCFFAKQINARNGMNFLVHRKLELLSSRNNVISTEKSNSLRMQLRSPTDQAAAFATSAAIAVSAVNAAVSMRTLEAPEVDKTYIVQDSSRLGTVDESGLPIVYDKELIGVFSNIISKQVRANHSCLQRNIGGHKTVPCSNVGSSSWA